MKYIGKDLTSRMKSLGISADQLAKMTFIDDSIIESLMNDTYSYDDMDDFDKKLVCDALHCDEKYFDSKKVKSYDLLFATMNRGNDTVKSNLVKIKIQDYMRDYAFVEELMQ